VHITQAQGRTLTLAQAVWPKTGILSNAALVIGFAALTAVFAQISIRIPTTTVPITGQTFAVLTTGAALGSRRGALSMFVYMLMGMFLFPAFAPPSSVLAKETIHFVLPWAGTKAFVWDLSSGGYLVGFILASYLVGRLAEYGHDRRAQVSAAMVLGNIALYLPGLAWLAFFIASGKTIPGLDLTYYDAIEGANVLDKTLRGGLYPFIAGDAVKLLLASMMLPGAWQVVRSLRSGAVDERP